MKRVTCIINGMTNGGAERVMSILCNEFVNNGIETTLIVRQDTDSSYHIDDRINYVATSLEGKHKLLRNIKRNMMMRKLIKESHPDVIISFMTSMNLQAIVFTHGLGIPLIVSERIDPRCGLRRVYKFLVKLLYPLCDGIVFQTEDAKSYFSNRIQKRAIVIGNPISPNLPAHKDCDSKKIVSVGRLSIQKNHFMTIDAFCEFSKTHPGYTLTIYGSGPLKSDLQNYIKKLKMSSQVKLGGFSNNIPVEICDADMFVMSSHFEGMPNALMEAMGIGLPCISTDCPGASSVITKNGINGILVPVNDTNALVDAMIRIADDREYAKKLSLNAIEINQTMSVKSVFEQWKCYCEQLIN